MTKKDFSTVQRMLGLIQGASVGAEAAVENMILDAVEAIDAILYKEVLTEDEK